MSVPISGSMSGRSNFTPPGILRYEENVIFGVCITIILETVALSNKLLITPQSY